MRVYQFRHFGSNGYFITFTGILPAVLPARIVVVDSGLGGVYLGEQLQKAFPGCEVITETDTEHLPYGEKTRQELRILGLALLEKALRHTPDFIVIGCHTLCSWCFSDLEAESPVPLLSVNDALLQEIGRLPTHSSLFLMGTTNTIESSWFQTALRQFRSDILVTTQACPELASAIEEQDIQRQNTLLEQYLPTTPHDAIALACTHYSLVRERLEAQLSSVVLDAHSTIQQETALFLRTHKIL